MTDAGINQHCVSKNTEDFDRSGNNICRNLEAGSEVKGMLGWLAKADRVTGGLKERREL